MVPIGLSAALGLDDMGLEILSWKARARPSPARQTLVVIPEAWKTRKFFLSFFFANILQYLGDPTQLLTRSSSLIATVTVEPF
jgi:hypothetical protein